MSQVYTYGFCVHLDGQHPRMNGAVKLLYKHPMRQELEFTESDFNSFRENLAKYGLLLVEIDRRPFQEPETVL